MNINKLINNTNNIDYIYSLFLHLLSDKCFEGENCCKIALITI